MPASFARGCSRLGLPNRGRVQPLDFVLPCRPSVRQICACITLKYVCNYAEVSNQICDAYSFRRVRQNRVSPRELILVNPALPVFENERSKMNTSVQG